MVGFWLIFLASLIAPSSSQPLTPTTTSFPSAHSLPAFSLRLGDDTAAVCNSSTPWTSGYIDTEIDDSHVFFWLVESKQDASTDPVILWMTGSWSFIRRVLGGLMELGPCRISSDGSHTVENPYGWNANATVLFVNQPVTVGFSYSSSIPKGLADASLAMDRFLRQFMTAFPQLAGRDFHIAGESYGGSWVPALGATILRRQAPRLSMQAESSLASPPTINLKGVIIGNGLVRLPVQNPGAFEAFCSGANPLLNETECQRWAPRAMWCEAHLPVCESSAGWTSEACIEAMGLCSEMTNTIITERNLTPYDWRSVCEEPALCYPEIGLLGTYLNPADIKANLDVPAERNFTGVSEEIIAQWTRVGDSWRSSDGYVNELLDKGIRTLIYVGDKDMYVHAAGSRRLVNQGLAWNGHPFFYFQQLVPWYVGGAEAGVTKAYEPLTYVEVAGSGHMAPYDQGERVLALVTSWISGVMPG